MSKLNKTSVRQKINNYVNSKEFRKRKEDALRDMSAHYNKHPEISQLYNMGREFEHIAASIGSQKAPAISQHFYNMDVYVVDRQVIGNTVRLWFEGSFSGDLHRDSLNGEYDGVDNIVALLNKGYKAQDRTYGVWESRHPFANVPSLQFRMGAYYLEDIAWAFINHCARLGIRASVEFDEEYNVHHFDTGVFKGVVKPQ